MSAMFLQTLFNNIQFFRFANPFLTPKTLKFNFSSTKPTIPLKILIISFLLVYSCKQRH